MDTSRMDINSEIFIDDHEEKIMRPSRIRGVKPVVYAISRQFNCQCSFIDFRCILVCWTLGFVVCLRSQHLVSAFGIRTTRMYDRLYSSIA
jgi:hypothetical protein